MKIQLMSYTFHVKELKLMQVFVCSRDSMNKLADRQKASVSYLGRLIPAWVTDIIM